MEKSCFKGGDHRDDRKRPHSGVDDDHRSKSGRSSGHHHRHHHSSHHSRGRIRDGVEVSSSSSSHHSRHSQNHAVTESSRSNRGESSRPSRGESPTSSLGESSRPSRDESPRNIRGGSPRKWGQPTSGFQGDRSNGNNVQSRLREMAAMTTVDLTEHSQDPPPRRGDGGGRGGGRGGGEGGKRARRPRPTDAQRADFVHTRPEHITSAMKKADESAVQTQGNAVALVANYYALDSRSSWTIYHYHVDFIPDIERTIEKRALFRPHASKFSGWHIFDGNALFVSRVIPENLLELYVARGAVDEKVMIKINPNATTVSPNDPFNIQIYNTVIRNCMRELELREIGRHYYDDKLKITKAQHRLEIWPGYKTSLRQHERSLMLCVEMTNKVLRLENVYEYMINERFNQDAIGHELIGSVVMTYYNKRTYRIDDIRWDENPVDKTFECKGHTISLKTYMEQTYPDLTLKHHKQPILYSLPKKNEIRRGMKDPIALIPEFCHMTGLKDSMRRNFTLMRELNVHLQLNPDDRVRAIDKFNKRLQESKEKILTPAGLQFSSQLVKVQGRQLKPETVCFGNSTNVPEIDKYEWTNPMQGSHMFETVPLKNWAIVATEFDGSVHEFIRMISDKAKRMNFIIQPNPRQVSVQRTGNLGQQVRGFLSAIEEVMLIPNIQMVLIILPTPNESLYGEIKRKCYLEYGIASQCVQIKHLNASQAKKGQQSGVASKLAVQMSAKLGGIPWHVNIPPNQKNPHNVMVVGFNISNAGRTKSSNTGRGMGALVASINGTVMKYFSVIVEQERGQLLSTILGVKMTLALHTYRKKNEGKLPEKIIFYRDGVGEGQLQSVVDTEVKAIEQSFVDIYEDAKVPAPKFAFIVVNKRINTKFFVPPDNRSRQHRNPNPGTCVDDVLTLPERYDFYLISQKGTGQGTVSPASYNVIRDTICWKCHHLQLLTYKLCHLYFNWSSTLAVPAPCQYAHKLAFLQNVMNKAGRRDEQVSMPRPQLCETLYYL